MPLLPKSRDKVALAIVAAVLAAVIGGALYLFLPDSLVIDDLSRRHTYRLSTGAEDKGIYGIEISGQGEFQGTVKLELMTRDGKVIREVTLENGGSFELQTDWYASEAFVRVTPATAGGGEIKLRYRFVEFL
jgi:hypothetical protein